MMRLSQRHAAVALLTGVLALGALEPAAPARVPLPTGAARAAGAARPEVPTAVLITTLKVIPKVQRTVRFVGYATYVFHAPRGRRIVSASARVAGAAAHAVKIRRRLISRNRRLYIVNLIFPGEQGDPGKLVVRLATVA